MDQTANAFWIMLLVKIEWFWSKATIKQTKKAQLQYHGCTMAPNVSKCSFELIGQRLSLKKTEWALNQTLQKSNSAQGDPHCLAWIQSNEHFKVKDKTGDPHPWTQLYTICIIFFSVYQEIKSPKFITKIPGAPLQCSQSHIQCRGFFGFFSPPSFSQTAKALKCLCSTLEVTHRVNTDTTVNLLSWRTIVVRYPRNNLIIPRCLQACFD